MNQPHRWLVLGITLVFASYLHAGSKPLTIADLESWKRISETVVSPDGKWIAHRTEPGRGDSRVYLYSRQGETRFEQDCGKGLQITDDSQFMVFTIAPAYERIRELKRRQTPTADVPGETLGIYALGSGRFESIADFKSYKLPEKWAGWLAYQVETRAPAKDGQERSGKRESGESGFTLHLRNLANGENRSWPFVTDYGFAAKAKRLFFVSTGNDQGLAAGLYLFDVESAQIQAILSGAGEYRQIAVSELGDRAAFLLKPQDKHPSTDFSLYLWTGQGPANKIVGRKNKGVPEGWRISENSKVFFSRNSGRVFFGTAPVRPARNPSILDDEFPEVDIWHGRENVLHTEQLANRERELKRTCLAMYDLQARTLVQIETKDLPESRLLAGGDADHVLLHGSKPYELESMWNSQRYDVYLLNLITGERRTVVAGTRERVGPSPEGRYLVWFNDADYSYYTYGVESGQKQRITTPSVIRADTETNTTFDYNTPYGSAGWLRGDRAILIYDRYDLWKVDPENRHAPVNLTVNGRQEQTVYRLLRLDKQDALDPQTPHYLLGTHDVSRATGY